MFDKILIANRGEIACRVIDTARRLGVRTVAVYSDADAGARHVALADEAVHIGAAPVAESYLRGKRIIDAALQTGAGAIHPGYGFLSENPDFVDQVTAAGLIFIGPSASAIRAMGLKDAAKALMEQAGVPIVPGYHGADQDAHTLARHADAIGYPVLIKARAGGGGKGMRRVDQPQDFAKALEGAQREGQASFGDAHVLIEKWITTPRHIEIQVFGDGQDAVHLYERDCSLQRRHQKVIEEAPAPGMTPEMRSAMGDAAVRAARAIGYSGAGTVEFIVDGSKGLRPDGFWFMEMNTRLQVEHPVTEAITGIDLVEWQLRIAAGEALPMAQADIPLNGHAFEARLYAEDAARGFLPATGTLTHLHFGDNARIDTGIRAGDTISPHYDPMIAKITTHGPTRDIALAQLHRALGGTEVAGSVTNLPFLAALAAHDGFARGDVDTGLIERDQASLTALPPCPAEARALAALIGLGLTDAPTWDRGFTLWAPLRQQITLMEGEAMFTAHIESHGPDSFQVHLEGADTPITVRGLSGGRQAVINGKPLRFTQTGHSITIFNGAVPYVFARVDPLASAAESAAGGNTIVAPMPGLVKLVSTTIGASVSAGDALMILEAMKMEHTLTAPRDGVVAEILAPQGAQVADGDVLLILEGNSDA